MMCTMTVTGHHYPSSCHLGRLAALSMDMLCCLDKEILIGQVSYKQWADIYYDALRYSVVTDDCR